MFHCQKCDLKGSRNDSYKFLEGQNPSFTDECPRCQSDDVEVFDAELVDLAAPGRGYETYN